MGATSPATNDSIGYDPRATAREARGVDARDDSALGSTAIYLFALGFVLLFGTLVRIGMLFSVDFPLNDGGMFMQAIVDLQHSHYMLPQTIHYNGLSIPYAYPPLGFYVAGLIADLTHASIFTVLRIVPATFSVLTIVAFMLLANSFLRNRYTVVVASLAFALVPRSHNWEIMGGGLTRSIGFFFATLAIWQAYLLFTQRTRSALIWTTVLAALACLSHLEMAWFVAFSSILLFLTYGRTRTGFRDSLLVSLGVLALTSPWWGLVIARHGIEPFINAGHTGGHSIAVILALLLTLNWGQEPLFPIFGALALIGILYCIVHRRYFLPLWVIVGLFLDPRKFETEAMVPMSMIVGICVIEVIVPLIRNRLTLQPEVNARQSETLQRITRRGTAWVGPIVLGIVVLYGMTSALVAAAQGDVGLSSSERQAMEWARTSTAPDSRFAIITGDQWALDRSSEWFPVIADRTSTATVQGKEWLPDGAYSKQAASYKALQECAYETVDCFEDWTADEHMSYDYVYIATRALLRGDVYSHSACCSGLVASFEADPNYALVFQNDDAAIFERKSAIAGLGTPGAALTDRDRTRTPL